MRSDFGEMLDTSPANRARYYELLRQLTPEQRAAKAASLSRMVRELAREALKREFPLATTEELNVRLAVRLYGRAIAERLFANVPPDAR